MPSFRSDNDRSEILSYQGKQVNLSDINKNVREVVREALENIVFRPSEDVLLGKMSAKMRKHVTKI